MEAPHVSDGPRTPVQYIEPLVDGQSNRFTGGIAGIGMPAIGPSRHCEVGRFQTSTGLVPKAARSRMTQTGHSDPINYGHSAKQAQSAGTKAISSHLVV